MALIKLQAPEGAETVGHGGQTYPVRHGFVVVPEDAAPVLCESHGYKVAGDPSDADLKDAGLSAGPADAVEAEQPAEAAAEPQPAADEPEVEPDAPAEVAQPEAEDDKPAKRKKADAVEAE